jgi:hypothetical protein
MIINIAGFVNAQIKECALAGGPGLLLRQGGGNRPQNEVGASWSAVPGDTAAGRRRRRPIIILLCKCLLLLHLQISTQIYLNSLRGMG